MRSQHELDSADGIVRSDADHIIHRYKFPESGRNLQAVMLIEVKTFVDFSQQAKRMRISDSQADSLHIINQLARNRVNNIHKKRKWQPRPGIRKVKSLWAKKDVYVRFYGVHGLYFSASNPDDSDRIEWDHKKISPKVLISLLRFELDPDTTKPIDLRIHQRKTITLFTNS